MERKAKQTIAQAYHAALATLNEDGSPYVIPVHLFIDEDRLYWFSSASSRHAQNTIRDARVSITQWSVTPGASSTAVYIQSKAALLAGEEAERAHEVARARLNSPQFDSLPAYGAALGTLDTVVSSENRWYFYS